MVSRKDFIKTLVSVGAAFTVGGLGHARPGDKVHKFKSDRVIPQDEYDRLVSLYDGLDMLDDEVPVVNCFDQMDDAELVYWVEWNPDLLDERTIDLLKDKGFNISHTKAMEWRSQQA